MSDIDPRVDIAFKKIFGVEENEDLLISLINSIVGPEDQVQEIILLNPYNLQSHKNDKLSILDIKAKGKDGKRFNIEIQITDEGNYDKRGLYYWAKVYTDQLQRSAKDVENGIKPTYGMLSKTIGIHILNFNCVPEAQKYHNVFHVTEKESGLRFFTDFELHTIELDRFLQKASESLGDIVTSIRTSLDRWAAFLTRHNLLDRNPLPPELDDPALKKAMHVLDVMNFTASEREDYENHLKWLMLQASALEKKFLEGKAEGRAEEAREIAQKMLIKGRGFEDVCEVTELSLEEFKKLSCGIERAKGDFSAS